MFSFEEYLVLVGVDATISKDKTMKVLKFEYDFKDDASQWDVAEVYRFYVRQKGWKFFNAFVRDLIPT